MLLHSLRSFSPRYALALRKLSTSTVLASDLLLTFASPVQVLIELSCIAYRVFREQNGLERLTSINRIRYPKETVSDI